MKKLFGFLVLYILVGCDEQNESFYATLVDAEEDGAIRRGIIPENLPESSYNIATSFDIDTNEIWGEFSHQEGGKISVREDGCFNLERLETKFPRKRVSWWPKQLSPEAKKPNSDFIFYRCPERRYIAISNSGKGYFWYLPY